MSKEEYINSNILKLLHHWTNVATGIGSLVIISMSFLDYLVTPANFKTFFLYRICAAAAILLTYLYNRKISRARHHAITIAASVIVSTMVALMIAKFGGHQSPYFAGIILTVTFVVGLAPLNITMCIIASAVIYAIYLIPILSYDVITNKPFFINANFFILAVTFAIVLFRYLINQRFVSEFGLQYDLEQQKKQLEMYSTQLEHLVEERTRELNKSELMLRSLFENANDGIMIMNRDGIILNVNQKACDIHGFDRDTLIGTNIKLLETQENLDSYKERLERILNGESLLFETRHYRRDGNKVSLEISSKAIAVEGITYVQSFQRDITEKKRLQEQLFQSQKMESIGILAGGIAHDFNNILSAILGHADLLHEFSNLDDAGKEKVRIIQNGARKAGQMISKLLSFARKASFETVPVNLNDIVRDTVDLMERMMTKRDVTIRTDVDTTIPSIAGDANQLEQVIVNIVVNSGDVMPKGGLITISTSAVDLGRNAGSIHPLLAPGKYVVLKLSDTGPGIPDEIRDKIFDPFFTTKETGKGTGLGLAMVYGIVKEHGGAINVQSQAGKGATFEIYLPASGKLIPRVERPFVSSVAGREKILVVDDEEDILSFVKDVLESQGYKVVGTTNPVYALDLFKEIKDTIDLVISDIIMPLVNGRELIRHFKLINPSVKIMAISGYEGGTVDKKDKDINAFIRKPFEGIYLLTVVRRVLDAADKPSSRRMPL